MNKGRSVLIGCAGAIVALGAFLQRASSGGEEKAKQLLSREYLQTVQADQWPAAGAAYEVHEAELRDAIIVAGMDEKRPSYERNDALLLLAHVLDEKAVTFCVKNIGLALPLLAYPGDIEASKHWPCRHVLATSDLRVLPALLGAGAGVDVKNPFCDHAAFVLERVSKHNRTLAMALAGAWVSVQPDADRYGPFLEGLRIRLGPK